ncbi:MAG TPA: YjbH domain-containing protein [Acidiferrobacterales bacterium]|nr:YjbH domain-containing protein [Acidiferrobacterales bacterium]
MAALIGMLPGSVLADASLIGQSGLVHMPDARIAEEGTLSIGVSNIDPYFTIWSSLTVLPRLELTARFTKIDRVPGGGPDSEFGDYRDKSFDAKLLLLKESPYLPALSIGTQDFTGTRLFNAKFLTLGKHFSDVDVTLGYGTDRIDGAFGGIRYRPSWNKNLGFVAEYDANDYKNDFRAPDSGADQRKGGATYAIEYRYGWIGAQLSYQGGDVGANLYVSIPLMQREFVPKIDEPAPYTEITRQPTLKEESAVGQAGTLQEQAVDARGDARNTQEIARALERQGFKNVRLRLDGTALEASLTHPRISLIGRAVGRAARTMVSLGPGDIETVRITYTQNDLPLLTFHFTDAKRLQAYFVGLMSQEFLDESVEVSYASPEYAERFRDKKTLLVLDDPDEGIPTQTYYGDEGHIVSIRREDPFLSGFRLIPFNLRLYFVDPSGDASYDTFSTLAYQKYFGSGLFLNGAARLTLFENVSDVTRPSVSVLPHVRTDIALYKQEESRLKLNGLLLNKYSQLADRIYARLSAGYYEEMFAGAGGQVLYLPRRGNWAADLSVDWLRQRAPEKDFGFRDYSVATALLAFHYRIPEYGITATARAGRFLAKDEGVRFELKRRFHSGIEAGIWFTRTNENDQTQPNRPKEEFLDRGLFISIPLASMLTKDTQEHASLAVVEATRDVGQMVESPGDLYRLIEQRLALDAGEIGLLTDFAN